MWGFIAALAIFTAGTLGLLMQAQAGTTDHIISVTGPLAENGRVTFIELAPSDSCAGSLQSETNQQTIQGSCGHPAETK